MFFPRIPPFSAQNLFEKHNHEKHPTRKKAPAPPVQRHRVRTVDSPGVSIDAAVYSKGYSCVSKDVTLVSWLYVFLKSPKKHLESKPGRIFFLSEWE